jgi:photosystem II stability/assembly factor-like uncharacterized protein
VIKLLVMALLVACAPALVKGQRNIIEEDFSYPFSEHEVSALFFLDSSNGWMAVFDNMDKRSYVLQTSDGGKTWSHGKAFGGRIYSLAFISPQLGWALSGADEQSDRPSGMFVIHTDDGAKNWRRASSLILDTSSNTERITALSFIDSHHGWFAGSGPFGVGLILHTSDGGKTTHKVSGLSNKIGGSLGISAQPNCGVWIYGNRFVIYSRNLGKTWEQTFPPKELNISKNALSISSAFFLKDGRGYLAGQAPDASIFSTKSSCEDDPARLTFN